MYWRQRAPFRSRTRDRQSSYNPQLCSACAPRTVVRRYLGSRPSTRARTRGACSPAPPGGDTAFLSEIGEITLIAHHSRLPPSPAAAVSGPSLRYIETSRPATVSHARRRAYPPCHSMRIIAGGSGARATADSASPHALWPAAARRTAPCSSPPADWDDPWRCVIAGSGKLGPAPVNTRLGDASAREESAVCFPVWDAGLCRDFMVRKCSEEVIRGGPALLSVGTDIPERAGARGRFCI